MLGGAPAVATSAEAMATSLKSASVLVGQIHRASWGLFDGIRRINDQRAEAAKAVLNTLAVGDEGGPVDAGARPRTRWCGGTGKSSVGRNADDSATAATWAAGSELPPVVVPPEKGGRWGRPPGTELGCAGRQAPILLRELEKAVSEDSAIRLDIVCTLSRLEDRRQCH